jgi:apolipoprotein N-acyltransferase
MAEIRSEPGQEALPGLFARWSRSVAALSGLRRVALALAAGLLASLALPPLYLVFFLLPAFVLLLWLSAGARSPGLAAWIGWLFGVGYFTAGLYWVGIAFFVDAARFGLVMPLAVGGLAAGMALFPALALYIVARSKCQGAARIFLLAAAWVFTEWLRSWVFTGFPWNLLGTVWGFSPAVMQAAAYGGVWLLSAMTVAAAASPALLAWRRPSGRHWPRCLVAAMLLSLPLWFWLFGALRLAGAPPATENTGVALRIVQPAIDQKLKWQADLRLKHVLQQIRMSQSGEGRPPAMVIWAEAAVPALLDQDPELRRLLVDGLPGANTVLLTGAPRVEKGEDRPGWRNSLFALAPDGSITAVYDKVHLVPFGEYTPLKDWLGLEKLAVGASDFVPGFGPATLTVPGLPPFSPLICYEVIFPGDVVAPAATGQARPEWLLNLTNDAWFGRSSGPYQHFVNVRLRAVEEGLPVVRAANSGISAIVDGYGRVVAELGLGKVGVIDGFLPKSVASITTYAIIGNWALAIQIAMLVILTLVCVRLRL